MWHLKGNIKVCPILWLIFNIFNHISMEEITSLPLTHIQIQQCPTANANLTQSLNELNENFRHLMTSHLEFLEKLQILEERQLKAEQQQLQQQNKLLQKLQQIENLTKISETVILRRQDGSVDFDRTWQEFKQGFGDASGEFFIGLDNIHKLTNSGPCELLIVLEAWDNERRYAKYNNFVVGSEREYYKLHSLGQYSGTAGDDFSYNVGQKFTTRDLDNDLLPNANCAVRYRGAWWHTACYKCNLNGPYKKGRVPDIELGQIVQWHAFRGNQTSLKFAEMTVRLK
ncbi:angiopoietin-related protein 2 [Musca domestica]|uniref:Angiopoietin-related protein 2 n=1 Tax=Musca domestica TaxID=7370 RepID=A0A1I8N0B9_MUSDO|nr:angiopoietin-related protein 2 [Musca domestica]